MVIKREVTQMVNREVYEYSKSMSKVKLTLWDDLPDFAIYAVQLLQIVEDQTSFMKTGDDPLITKSMVNNYVKWGMMPKPVKKKYEKIHIAYVIIITILKQVLSISKIEDGVQLQIKLQGSEQVAYDSFCNALEESMKKVFDPIGNQSNQYILEKREIAYDKLAISVITSALCNKLLTEKIIETKMKKDDSEKS